ncbi:MAG: asparagine synthase-related protein, partial [Thermoanaerobaculia bacterium]
YPSFADVPRLERTARRLGRVPGLAAAWPPLARAISPGRPKLAGLLRYGRSLPGAYFLRRGLFLPEELSGVMGPDGLYDPVSGAGQALAGRGQPSISPWTAVHLLESALYMRNQLLRDSDWASMAWSVELRVPLVDAWLYRRLEANGFEPARSSGKAELARRTAPELPEEILRRPKTGFYIPMAEWMRPELAAKRPGERSRWLALRVLEAFR